MGAPYGVGATHVYALRAPGCELVSYVGATTNMRKRAHLRRRQSLLARTAVERWLADLAARNLQPEVDVLEIWHDPKGAKFAERWLLWGFIAAGHPILNEVRWDVCWLDEANNLTSGAA